MLTTSTTTIKHALLAVTVLFAAAACSDSEQMQPASPVDQTTTSTVETSISANSPMDSPVSGSMNETAVPVASLADIAEQAESVVVATLTEVREVQDTPRQLAGEVELVRVYFVLSIEQHLRGNEVPDGSLFYGSLRSIRDGVATSTDTPGAPMAKGDTLVLGLGPAEPDGSLELIAPEAFFFVDNPEKAAALAGFRMQSGNPLGRETQELTAAEILERLQS